MCIKQKQENKEKQSIKQKNDKTKEKTEKLIYPNKRIIFLFKKKAIKKFRLKKLKGNFCLKDTDKNIL